MSCLGTSDSIGRYAAEFPEAVTFFLLGHGRTGSNPRVPAKSRYRQVRLEVSQNPVSRELRLQCCCTAGRIVSRSLAVEDESQCATWSERLSPRVIECAYCLACTNIARSFKSLPTPSGTVPRSSAAACARFTQNVG
jgi:hypothetical protein